ncbi:tetratricopeptide repeat protein [Chryseobacterium shigense]|uniref:Tetratricopeptide (TPR) repeat protein n=1 Tax=Chryseobacterium shigense TaxID=297244 RepID=A0A841N7R3_9FLAO|nr:tetratricopeptide repeat protein [Chryseobacterium shigense]MBB6369538.1 tetratricopeptide (TPR) repeat protein [Chryseobacterium shigense]
MIKKRITILIPVFICSLVFGQKDKGFDKKELIRELSDKACKCTDSIALFNRDKKDILKDVHDCIDKSAGAMQLGVLMGSVETLKKDAPEVNGKKQVNLTFNTDKNSQQYMESYNELERYLMENCTSVRHAAMISETKTEGLSKDPAALEFYHKALEASQKKDWKEAIQNGLQAVKKDPQFIYAWDNLGINYRRTGEYDKSLDAYKKSLEIDPKGKMPLQNIPLVYVYKNDFQKAIDAYLALEKVYPGDPEMYYGIGQVYFSGMKDDEKALDYICKAYRIYTEQKSPYRTDAETMMSLIYKNMKEKGKIEKFKEILKKNNMQF